MFRRALAIFLSAILLVTVVSLESVFAQGPASGSTALQEKVERLDTGRNARVEVKLKDGSKVKGYISSNATDSFTVMDSKTNVAQTLEYGDVVSVKKPSSGISPLTWGIIAGAAVAATIVGFTIIKPVLCDGGAGY